MGFAPVVGPKMAGEIVSRKPLLEKRAQVARFTEPAKVATSMVILNFIVGDECLSTSP